MRVVALVPAAGSGSRLGGPLPKPFVPIAGRPLLAHTLLRLEAVSSIEGIVVVVAPGLVDACRLRVIEPARLRKVLAVVEGGAERQTSVSAGLAALPSWAEVVLVHDGARPLVPPWLIEAVARAAAAEGAALAAVRPKDTVKMDDGGGRVQATLDRTRLWLAQTPQGFRVAWLREAHARAAAEGAGATDDAALVERLGRPVVLVPGSYRNLKVTTAEDLRVAEVWLAEEAELAAGGAEGWSAGRATR